jgi:hypothetical protein
MAKSGIADLFYGDVFFVEEHDNYLNMRGACIDMLIKEASRLQIVINEDRDPPDFVPRPRGQGACFMTYYKSDHGRRSETVWLVVANSEPYVTAYRRPRGSRSGSVVMMYRSL